MKFSVHGVFAIFDYGSLSLTLSGHLRVVFDFGFECQELIFPGKHFGLGQYHDVRITRKDSGSRLIMTVRKVYLNLRFKKRGSSRYQRNNFGMFAPICLITLITMGFNKFNVC